MINTETSHAAQVETKPGKFSSLREKVGAVIDYVTHLRIPKAVWSVGLLAELAAIAFMPSPAVAQSEVVPATLPTQVAAAPAGGSDYRTYLPMVGLPTRHQEGGIITNLHSGDQDDEKRCTVTFNHEYADSNGNKHVVVVTAGECFGTLIDNSPNYVGTTVESIDFYPFTSGQNVTEGSGARCSENGPSGRNFGVVDMRVSNVNIGELDTQAYNPNPVLAIGDVVVGEGRTPYNDEEKRIGGSIQLGIDNTGDGQADKVKVTEDDALTDGNYCDNLTFQREDRGGFVSGANVGQIGVLSLTCTQGGPSRPTEFTFSTLVDPANFASQCDLFTIGANVATDTKSDEEIAQTLSAVVITK